MRISDWSSDVCSSDLSSLTACMVGPNYRAPPAVDTGSGWSRPVGEASAPTDLDRWWRALGDPELERLVDTALAQNLDIRQATARIDEARAARPRRWPATAHGFCWRQCEPASAKRERPAARWVHSR